MYFQCSIQLADFFNQQWIKPLENILCSYIDKCSILLSSCLASPALDAMGVNTVAGFVLPAKKNNYISV